MFQRPALLARIGDHVRQCRQAARRVMLFAMLAELVLAGLPRPMIAKEPETEKGAAKETEKGADKETAKEAGKETGGEATKPAQGASAAGGKTSRAEIDHAASRELRDIAEHSFVETLAFYESGDAFANEVYHWSRVILHLELELASDDESKLVSTQGHLDRMTNLAHAGLWRARELEYYVAEAELMLDRLKPNPDFAATVAARRALEGQWEVVSIEEEGGASPKPDFKSITIVGRRATFEHRLGTAKALLILDPSTKPASLDIMGLSEEFAFGGQGIYKLDGNKLMLCWGAGAVRPSDFVTKAGDSVILCVLKRAGSE